MAAAKYQYNVALNQEYNDKYEKLVKANGKKMSFMVKEFIDKEIAKMENK